MRDFRSGRAAFLVVLVAAGSSFALSSPAGSVAGFGDVAEDRFYTDAVQWMVDNDVTTGTSETCFSPDDPVTRGQAAAFMWRMEGEPSAGTHPFNDIFKSWQQEPVSWMYADAITTGTTAITYSPEDTLTRGQLAALLYRLARKPEGSPAHSFGDVVRPWQQDAVSWMSDVGITTGTTAMTFSPDDTVTRGQLAAFFYRYKEKPSVIVSSSSPYCGSSNLALELLATLAIGVEQRSGYDRDLFDHWSDLDDNGCDTRQDVLAAESLIPVTTTDGCRVATGSWFSHFDGVTVTDPSSLDIDHLVPLAEAWDSGAWSWDAATRERFANDVDDPRSLIAVTASTNRSKSDRDPADWLPPLTSYRCTYLSNWVAVKARWSLSIDQAEYETLAAVLSTCPNAGDVADLPTPQIPSTTTTSVTPTTTTDANCHPAYSPCIPYLSGDALNCGDLSSAQRPVTLYDVNNDPYNLDGNNDGSGCT